MINIIINIMIINYCYNKDDSKIIATVDMFATIFIIIITTTNNNICF